MNAGFDELELPPDEAALVRGRFQYLLVVK